MKRIIFVVFGVLIFLLATPLFAEILNLEIHPRQFKEMNPDPQDEASMFVGMRFSIVNPNAQKIKNIDIEDFSIYSKTRGMVNKRDLGQDAWKHIQYVSIEPYNEFPYLDIVMVFARGTLDRYYAGDESLKIMFKVNYTDDYENIHRKTFRFIYAGGKFKEVDEFQEVKE